MRRLALLVAIPIVLAACGETERPVSGADPDQAVQAPAEPAPTAGAVTTPPPPAKCRRVSRRLRGRTFATASTITRKARCQLRMVIEDGRSLAVTEDFSTGRINVRVDDGVVTEILGLF